MDIQETLAANIHRYRKEAGLTQERLAEKCGLHRTYIGGIEQCRVNVGIKNAQRIAEALGISPHLLFWSPEDDGRDQGKRLSWHEAEEMVEHALLKTGGTSYDGDGSGGFGNSASHAYSGSREDAPSKAFDRSRFFDPDIKYAFCVITESGVQIEDLDVVDPDIAIQILSALIYNHCRQEDLAAEFHRIQSELMEFIGSRAQRQSHRRD